MQCMAIGPVMNSARAEAVQGVSSHPEILYAAFGSGGLWKSVNAGQTWDCIFQNEAALGIGDVAVAPSDPDILYLGTGESLKKQRNFTFPGTGIYKSTDGGHSWVNTGLQHNWHVGEIAIHPDDPNTVLVAAMGKFWSDDTSAGIYRTENGGQSWKKVWVPHDHVRANDVVFSPSNPNIVYATVWENQPDSVLFESVWGPGSSVYRSDDAGITWKEISNGLPEGPKKGRIGVAVSHQNPDKVYILMDNHNNDRQLAPEIYKTTNGGARWSKSHKDSLLFASVIGWYFSDIYVNPQNDEEIFALGVRIAHSRDGGKTFDYLGGNIHHMHPSAAQTLHLDQCELWIDPERPERMLLANDGGVYSTFDAGVHWMHHNSMPVGEFYTITLNHESPYLIYGGTQDNSTVYGPSRELEPSLPDPWQYLWIDAWSGGDGCVTHIDWNDSNTLYYSLQNGVVRRRDVAMDTSIAVRPDAKEIGVEELRFHFVTPYFLSPHRSSTIYLGANYVLKSLNQGKQWLKISPDLSISSADHKKGTAIGALEESKVMPGLLYAGTDQGACWVTKDDGNLWTEISEGLADGYIRSIVPSVHALERVYLAMTGLNYDDPKAYLYCSEDFGTTWQSIARGLPNEPVNVVAEDPVYPDIIYAGTHRGVYCSIDRGNSWMFLSGGMPWASVSDLKIHRPSLDLVIATHGRGLYRVNLTPLHDVFRKRLFNESLDPNPGSLLFLGKFECKAPKRRDSHGDIEIGSLEKVMFSLWSSIERDGILQIFNEENKLMYEAGLVLRRGLNQWSWDLVTERQSSLLPYFIHYNKYIEKGIYRVRVKSGELESWTSLVVGSPLEINTSDKQ